jgi:hypothetical protein
MELKISIVTHPYSQVAPTELRLSHYLLTPLSQRPLIDYAVRETPSSLPSAAWAAASLAIGTRYGEHET